MYVCMYVCVYVCMYVCICILYTYVYYIRMYVCLAVWWAAGANIHPRGCCCHRRHSVQREGECETTLLLSNYQVDQPPPPPH